MSSSKSISMQNGNLIVPNNPIIPFIEGDGIGQDIWNAAVRVFNSAVENAYDGNKKIDWLEVLAGEKAFKEKGEWLPQDTLDTIVKYSVAIKGPLTTPVGGGIRSLNVALRQKLDLYACVRPVRWFEGVPSPVKEPNLVDMVIFRENTEDIYAGIEWMHGSEGLAKVKSFLMNVMGVTNIRFPDTVSLGVKPVSKEGTERIVKAAIDDALKQNRKSLTLVHKGNIMKFTEGAFRAWGYELVKNEFSDVAVSWDDCNGNPGDKILVQDVIADAFLQQILIKPHEFDVIATTNLNGDYASDALAAQIGGIGISPGGNINYENGKSVFEATHGTAPKHAGKDKANPGSLILSGEMMFRYMGWNEAADLIIKAMEKSISEGNVTYDLARGRTDAKTLSSSEFASNLVNNIESF